MCCNELGHTASTWTTD